MYNEITMEMSICQAENGFSLDESVKKLADAFENKASAEILKMNLQLTQEVLNAASEPVWASSKWISGVSVVQSAEKLLLHWRSSSVWDTIKPRVTSLKSW